MPLLQAYCYSGIPILDVRDAFLFVVAGALATLLIYKRYEVQPSSYIPTFILLVLTPYICLFFLVPHFTSTTIAYLECWSILCLTPDEHRIIPSFSLASSSAVPWSYPREALKVLGHVCHHEGQESACDVGFSQEIRTIREDGWVIVAEELSRCSKIVKFRNLTIQRATQRRVNDSTAKDLFYHLINEANQRSVERSPELSEIVPYGELAIAAGSDTTSTTLSGLFYYLLKKHPEYYARLQAEVDVAFPPGEGDPFDASRLAGTKYLSSMDLQHAVPTPLHRAPEKGTGGKWTGEHFISEGTAVNVPPYVLRRDPRYFPPKTDEFWPDRWLQGQTSPLKGGESEPVITNTAVFIPFSAGNRNCAGKNLAIAEMRVVVALLMQRFKMRFADGYDPCAHEGKLVDMFVMKVGELLVMLKPRA